MDEIKLPSNWIKRTSKSRANEVYYFNKATGKSQWHHPMSNDADKDHTPKRMANDKSKANGKPDKVDRLDFDSSKFTDIAVLFMIYNSRKR